MPDPGVGADPPPRSEPRSAPSAAKGGSRAHGLVVPESLAEISRVGSGKPVGLVSDTEPAAPGPAVRLRPIGPLGPSAHRPRKRIGPPALRRRQRILRPESITLPVLLPSAGTTRE